MDRAVNDLFAVALLFGLLAAFFFLIVAPSATILDFARSLIGA